MAHTRTANGSVFVSATLHPDDVIDLVNVASVLPGLETPLDNTAFLRLQDFPALTATQLAAVVAPAQGLIRTVKDSAGRMLGRFQFRIGATADTGAVAGVSYVAAGDSSGAWFSAAYAGVTVGGASAVTNAARSLLMFSDTPAFQTPRRAYVPIPLTTLVSLSLGSSGPVRTTGFNGTDYGHVFYSAGSSFTSLTGVQILNDSSYANGWIFRTRLARGSLVGMSLVLSCNGTGTTPSGNLLSPTVVATPLIVRVYELAGAAGVSAAAVSDYDSTSTFPSRGPKVWEGTVGVAGNSYLEIIGGTGGTGLGGGITTGDVSGLQALLLPSAPPKLFNFVSGTTTSSCKTTSGTNAPAVSDEKEYLVVVTPFTFSGLGYPSWATNGARPTIYKLEAWVDVTNLGAA